MKYWFAAVPSQKMGQSLIKLGLFEKRVDEPFTGATLHRVSLQIQQAKTGAIGRSTLFTS